MTEDKKSIILEDKDGVPIGKLYIAFTIAKDSNCNEIEIAEKDGLTYLTEAIQNSERLNVASSNEECKFVSIIGSMVKIDRQVKSVNSNILLKGDVIIIHEKIATHPA